MIARGFQQMNADILLFTNMENQQIDAGATSNIVFWRISR
jgi:hypothetical protein